MSNITSDTIDPRGGWTSASNALADSLCAGRHLAQRGIPETAGEYADSGRKVHAALAALRPGDNHANRPLLDRLTLAEQDMYRQCLDIRRRLCVQYFSDISSSAYREFLEQRYWVKFKVDGKEYAHSGQADFIARLATKALVIDYKTLPGEVSESPRNRQLRDLACLVHGNLIPTDEIAVAIVQPLVTQNPELCVYRKADLEQANKEMLQRVFASNQPQAKRVAGEAQCKYCRARFSCAEYQQWAGQISPPALRAILSVPTQNWTPDQWAVAAGAISPCEKLLGELKEMIKVRLTKDPVSVPGWELKPGAMRESITNPQAVFERFSALGGKVDQFMVCVDVAKGRLNEALNKLTAAKGKALDAAMHTLTDGLVESKQTAPSLKRKD